MNHRQIVIDGKTYKSVNGMPEDVRRNYESAMRNVDSNRNGTPDLFESAASFQVPTTNVINTTKIVVNGQVYDSVDQLPPDIRTKYEKAMGTMDANKNGIPDFVEGMLGASNQTNSVADNMGTATPPPHSKQLRNRPLPAPAHAGGNALPGPLRE